MWIVDAMNASAEAAGPGRPRNPHSHLEDGGHEPGPGDLDRRLPDSVGGVSRHLALDGNDRGWATGRYVASFRSGIFVLPFHSHHGGGDRLRPCSSRCVGKGENPIGVSQIDSHGWVVLAIGFVVSFLVAYAAVAWFMAWVRKHGFVPFAVYRIVAGILVLAFAARLAG